MTTRLQLALVLFIAAILFLRYEAPNINFINSMISQNGASALGHVSFVQDTDYGNLVTVKFVDKAHHEQTVTDVYYFSESNNAQAKEFLYDSTPVHVHYLSASPSVFEVDELRSESFYEVACTIIFLGLFAVIVWSFLIPASPKATM
jgi:hypothetical protein